MTGSVCNMHLPWYWIDRRAYEYFAANIGARLRRHTPILVYQMGRVGSSSIRNSLFRARAKQTRLVLMSHEFYPVRRRRIETLAIDSGDRGAVEREIVHAKQAYKRLTARQKAGLLFREKLYSEMIYKNIIAKRQPAKVITLVREPVANNVSMFFQVFGEYADPGRGVADYATEELIQIFLDRYIHTRPLTWLDAELKTTLGIDVYSCPFPIEKGCLAMRQGHVELLVMKCELPDSAKERAIAEFVGLDNLTLVRSNVTGNKGYSRQYDEFRQSIRLPKSYLDRMYGSKYAMWFYGAPEREQLWKQWYYDRL